MSDRDDRHVSRRDRERDSSHRRRRRHHESDTPSPSRSPDEGRKRSVSEHSSGNQEKVENVQISKENQVTKCCGLKWPSLKLSKRLHKFGWDILFIIIVIAAYIILNTLIVRAGTVFMKSYVASKILTKASITSALGTIGRIRKNQQAEHAFIFDFIFKHWWKILLAKHSAGLQYRGWMAYFIVLLMWSMVSNVFNIQGMVLNVFTSVIDLTLPAPFQMVTDMFSGSTESSYNRFSKLLCRYNVFCDSSEDVDDPEEYDDAEVEPDQEEPEPSPPPAETKPAKSNTKVVSDNELDDPIQVARLRKDGRKVKDVKTEDSPVF